MTVQMSAPSIAFESWSQTSYGDGDGYGDGYGDGDGYGYGDGYGGAS